MTRLFPALIVLLCAWGITSCKDGKTPGESPEPGEVTPALKAIPINGYPDGIAKSGDRIFISCVRKPAASFEKKGEGYIFEVNASGEVVSAHAFPGVVLNSPKGMVVMDNVLYVADMDRIAGINLTDGRLCYELPIETGKGAFLMDIAGGKDGKLFAVIPNEKDIVMIDPGKEGQEGVRRLKINRAIPGIHGLALKGDKLYISGHAEEKDEAEGRLWVVDLKSGETDYLSAEKGKFDGIAVMGGDLYYSDWFRGSGENKAGAIRKMNLETGEISDVTNIPLKGVADFLIDEPTHSIWIPVYLDRIVLHAPLLNAGSK